MGRSCIRIHGNKYLHRDGRINNTCPLAWCKRLPSDSLHIPQQLPQHMLFEVCPSGSESEFEGVRLPDILCLRNLPPTTTREDVENFFSETAEVCDVKFKYSQEDGSVVGANVEFEDLEDVKKGFKLNGGLMGNHPILVSRSANDRRVFFVSGFGPDDRKTKMEKKIERRFDVVGGSVWKTYFPPNQRFAYALVEFQDTVDQLNIIEALDWSTDERGIFVRVANLKKRFGETYMNVYE